MKIGRTSTRETIGKIAFQRDLELGRGNVRTLVCRGSFEERVVAVKIVPKTNHKFYRREVSILQQVDYHPNVARYFCSEDDAQYYYIALEMCSYTLHCTISKPDVSRSMDFLKILHDTSLGLSFLHNLSIIHRDIKPKNVLLFVQTSSSGSSMDVVAKLSDFGFAKDCSHDSQSTLSAEYVTDDSNWMAPELLFPQNASEETDIYSLGCVYFYTLTHGAYFKTNSGALSSRKDHLSMLACALIGRMTKHEAGNRISSQDVTRNPLFWNADKVLNFIVDVSNRLENREMNEEIREEIRYIEADVVRENWYTKLDTPVVDALKARRSYDGSSMQDLVRAIRNLRLHYDVCSAEFRRFVGKLPEEYLNYWLRLFPNLVLSLYIIADRHLSQDITFHNLYLK